MSSNLKTFAAAAVVALASAAGAAAPAAAKGGHGHHHHHHHGFGFRYVAPVVVGSTDCSYYLARFEATGNRYWKRRYYQCIS